MTRLRSTVLLVLCALVTLVVGITGCRGGGKNVTIPGTAITIEFALPHDQLPSDGRAFCRGAKSIVLAIAEDVAGVPNHVLLLDTAFNLHGCGGAGLRCPEGTVINHDFIEPKWVVAEWVDLSPAEYAVPGSRSNVLCRGMYDERTFMGDLVPGTEEGQETLRIVLPLLRVGAMNGYFHQENGRTQPVGTFIGFSPLVHPSDLVLANTAQRTRTGGRALAAGGLVGTTASTALWAFEPDDLSFERLPLDLPVGRSAMSATPFAIDDTNHFVLLAGGADATGVATTASFLYFGSSDDDDSLIPGPSMFAPRAHHGASLLKGMPGDGALRNVIALHGGCNKNGTNPIGSLEYFLPPPNPPTALCRPESARGTFCTMGAFITPGCQTTQVPLDRQDADTILWAAGGGQAGLQNSTESRDLNINLLGSTFRASTTETGVRGAAAVEFGPSTGLVFGGDDAPFGNPPTPASGILRVTKDPALPLSAFTTMRTPRSFATATLMLDRRVLIAGGFSSGSERTALYEIGANVDSSGVPVFQTSYEPAPGGGPCDAISGAGCATMSAPRAEHSAVIVRGSATWVNGAVVFVGGDDGTALPEIYIPAYACDPTGTFAQTVDPVRSPIDEVDFCDRGKAPFLPIMDPLSPPS